jgi:hypothetical protein
MEHQSSVLHDPGESPVIPMLDHESVAEPLGIGLDVLVDPFPCLWCQRAEKEYGSFITHQYIGRGFGFDFHVTLFLQVLSACRICLSRRPPWNAVLSSVGGDAAWAPRS